MPFFITHQRKVPKSSAIIINLTELWLFPKWEWHLQCVLDTNHHLLKVGAGRGEGEDEVTFQGYLQGYGYKGIH